MVCGARPEPAHEHAHQSHARCRESRDRSRAVHSSLSQFFYLRRLRMFDDLIEAASGGWGVASAVIVGAGLLAARGGRPLLKRAIQGYLTASDTVRGWTAEVVEQAQDLY